MQLKQDNAVCSGQNKAIKVRAGEFLFVPVLIILLASCQREQDWGAAPDIRAKVESEQKTRTSLSVDESGSGTIYWNPSDKIDVFFGTKKAQYTSQNASDAIAATFKTSDSVSGTDVSSTNIWGLYPSNSSSSCNGSSITTSLPSTQYGVPNTFDKDIFPAVAHSSSTTLQFYNVCGGIKFNLAYDDIKKITFRGNNNEDLAGTVSISFVDNLPKATIVNGAKEITLTPKTGTTFTKGADYYFILLPVTLSAGFTITFTTTDGTTGTLNYTDNPVTIKRSIFGKKGNMDVYAAFADERQPNNVIYYTSADGQVVTPYKTDVFGANIVSNEYVSGRGIITFDGEVTSIGATAFSYCSGLTSIEIPNSVTSIGNLAFSGCSGLTSIEIPNSVTSIGNLAFSGCRGLTSIEIPNSVTNIVVNPFAGCEGLSSIIVENDNPAYDSRNGCNAIINSTTNELVSGCKNTIIPNSVTSIGNQAFNGCSGLTSIEIPNSVTIISTYAFYGCDGLTSIEIPNSVTNIVDNPFAGSEGLSSIIVENDNPAYDSRNGCNAIINSTTNELISGCKNTIIPNSVTSIGDSAFSQIALTSIEIPNSVTSIGYEAFYNCTYLTSIEIPNSVRSISSRAFFSCFGLSSIKVYALTPPFLGTRAFEFTANNCQIYVPAQSVDAYKTAEGWSEYADRIQAMPSQNNVIYYTSTDGQVVTPNMSDVFGANIVSNVYAGGRGVISFDGDVTSIGDNAFQYCDDLTSITLPDSVTSIGYCAFFYCGNLMSVDLPESLLTIGAQSFDGCGSLTSIDIPETVTSIGQYAFNNCIELTSIEIPDSVTSIGQSLLSNCPSLTSIVVSPGNTVYDSRNNCNAIIITENNELIAGCKNTVISNSVTSIGNNAFNYCIGLTSIEIPNSVTSIGNSAFGGCNGLTSIEIPNSVTSIGNSAFFECDCLTSIEIPNSVTSLGNYAFSYCLGLTSIAVLASVPPSVGTDVFIQTNDCPIYVPGGSVDAYRTAWSEYADRIQAIRQPNNIISYTSASGQIVTPYKTNVFGANIVSNEYVDGRGVITFDGDVSYIEAHAFYNCADLISIEIPGSVTRIGNYAFSTTGLTSLEIPNSVSSIGMSAFASTNLTSVEIPSSITSIGTNPFLNCNTLTTITVDSGNSTYDSRGGCNAIIHTSTNELISGCSGTVIPNTVTSIGNNAFYGCNGLTYLKIPNSVTSIGNSSFHNCSNLTCVEIPNSVTSIGSYAFYSTGRMSSIIIYAVSPPTVGSSAFAMTNGSPIYVPAQSVDAYKSAWSTYADRIQAIVVHEAVDLGLPSGLKWATCNVGATSPEEYGDYFAWGETSPKSVYDWSTYQWCNGSETSLTKYNHVSNCGVVDNKKTLELADDAARVNWGGSWRMPTKAEQDELRSNCSWEWTTRNGTNGILFTGPNGNSIFLPAAGHRRDSDLKNAGSFGYYWSSSLYSGTPPMTYVSFYIAFFSSGPNYDYYYRFCGYSIRPVKP